MDQSTKTDIGKLDNLNRPVFIRESESIINNIPKHKTPGSDGFIGEFYQTFKEERIPTLHNLFQKIEERKYPLTHSETSDVNSRDITRRKPTDTYLT